MKLATRSGRVFIAIGALIAGLAFTSGASAVDEDITPPQLDALSVTPNAVNVKEGPKSVKVEATVSDPAAFGGVSSGVANACISYRSPTAHGTGICLTRKITPTATATYGAGTPGGTLRADTRKVTAPFGVPAQNSDILVWDEKQNVALGEAISVDIAPPFNRAGASGTYDATGELLSTTIPAGRRVNSYFLHNNPAGLNAERSGCVTFGSNVLGVMVLSQSLNDSEQPNDDTFAPTTTDLGSPNTNYPDTQAEGSSSRGLELDNNNDYLHVSAQQVCVNFNVLDNQDEIRVITDAAGGRFEGTVTFQQFVEDGTWKPSVQISDSAGNFKSLSTTDLEQAGFNANVAVESIPDLIPPQISSLSLSPDSVTVSPPNGPQTVTATATITDNLSGVAGASVSFRSPDPFPSHSTFGSFQAKTTTTGAYDAASQGGTGRADTRKIQAPFFSFPAQDPDILVWDEKQNVTLGEDVSVDIDTPGFYENTNQLSTTAKVLAGVRVDSHFLHNNPAGLNSTRSGCVSFGSKVLGVMVLSHNLNGSEQPNDDTSSTTTTDLGSPGANYPDTQAEGSSSRGLELDNNNDFLLVNAREVCVNFNVLNNQDEIRVITEAVEDQYVAQIQVRPYVEHGTWSITSLSVSDRVNNNRFFGFGNPIPAGFEQTFDVVSDPEDFTPPELGSISVEPTCEEPGVSGGCVDVTAGDKTVTVKATVTDNLAGVSNVSVEYRSPSGRQRTFASLQRTTGDQFQGTMTMSRFAEAGHWIPTLSLSDGPGNFTSFSDSQLRDKGFDISIGVSRFHEDVAAPGGPPVTTPDEVSPTNPLVPSVSIPAGGIGGEVKLRTTPRTTEPPPDFYLLDQQLDITAPAQPDASHPLKIEFRVDSSVFSGNPQVQLPPSCVPGSPPADCPLTVFKNGDPVSVCTAVPPGAIAPDPCVVDPQTEVDDDRVITIYTTTASSWNVGIDLTISSNEPPDCSRVLATPRTLWPPNHHLRPVTLSGGTDPDEDDTLTYTITGVTQDEPVRVNNGDKSPDAHLVGSKLSLRAERNDKGKANGRVYRIAYELSDGTDSCSGVTTVSVPTSRTAKVVDSGSNYDSFRP